MRWLELVQLAKTGHQAGFATRLAGFSDPRRAEGGSPGEIYDLKALPDTFVMDYLADTGDGFDATYAVARSVSGRMGPPGPTQRADLLVLGGDQVYPAAKRTEYQNRLLEPFQLADEGQNPTGLVVALPGNHDWYDGLEGFRSTFCSSPPETPDRSSDDYPIYDPIGPDAGDAHYSLGRWTFQARSYFAIRLPHGWWLWAMDGQLKAPLDEEQTRYFTAALSHVKDHERIIVCTPTPAWTHYASEDRQDLTADRQVVTTGFVNKYFGASNARTRSDQLDQVRLMVSGDKHHYVRYEKVGTKSGPTQLVTCGGGGAYLSSTHHERSNLDVPWAGTNDGPTCYKRRTRFPSGWRSRLLSLGFLRIPFMNPLSMPLLLTAVVLGLALLRIRTLWQPKEGVLWLWSAVALIVVVLVVLSYSFRAHHPKLVALLPGLGHAAAYLTLVWWVTGLFHDRHSEVTAVVDVLGRDHRTDLIVACLVLAFGAQIIFATYFWVCDWFNFHANELFSGMRYAGYKSHLRISISPAPSSDVAGNVKVTVYGIRKSPKNRGRQPGQLTEPEVEVVENFEISGT